MTSGTAARRREERELAAARARAAEQRAERRARLRTWVLWGVGAVVVGVLVTAGLLSSRPTASSEVREAPPFTLPTSDGSEVSLADYRGEPVVLYFNEGAGCDSCLQQMAEIEKDADFAQAGITVLPIVMNTADQINADRERLGVESPFLLDDGTVSEAYGTLGTGMHEGLPGHGFVLVDAEGQQVWQGDYPSMWLAPDDLLAEVRRHL